MRYTISMSLLLLVFWLVNSGYYNFLLLFLGVVSVVLVIVLSRRMNVVDHESQPLNLVWRIPGYWLWLVKEIILANIDVTWRIWRGNTAIDPSQLEVKAVCRTDMGRVIFANSITLMPGTVAMEVSEDRVLVHALSTEAVDDLESGALSQRVSRLEL